MGIKKGQDLKERTKRLAVKVIALTEELPKNRAANVLIGQLIRSATSVGANYRAACRAKSRADFIAKMGIVEEEADETLYWMELFVEANLIKQENVEHLQKEYGEILAITVASIKTAKLNKNSKFNPNESRNSTPFRNPNSAFCIQERIHP
jgi:four helix bundle protein